MKVPLDFSNADPTLGSERHIPRWIVLAILFMLVAVAVLFSATIYMIADLRSTQARLEQAAQKVQAQEEQFAKLKDQFAKVDSTYKNAEKGIMALRQEVSSTRSEINQAARHVETQVLSKTQQIAERLTAEQRAAMAKVGGEVDQLRSAATDTESKLGALGGEVTGVKSEVSSTKAELQKTIAELKSVRGDLGVQSGLIATNASELTALKRLGERNYFEFDLKKTKQPQRVGSVSIKLKGTDTKRNRFTLEVIADDKLTLKKDRTINEPVQFYVAKAKIPYEIVVNQVAKDRIMGYMATPKDQAR